MAFIIIILVILVVGLAGGSWIFLSYRRDLREAKNYERGLKMVPLLIHLPPTSDDIEVGSRDVRDVTEENISKATVLYNILASISQKGAKTKFYGQRHLAFEIVCSRGLIHYYAAVPLAMVAVVKQAVVSAYPTAQLEEVEEHNIFSPIGKLTGTIGGELTLKEDYSYPIATYQDLKRDAMQPLLNAFSALSKEDGAGIQIMLRPAFDGWTKHAVDLANKKRKDKGKKQASSLSMVKQIIMAFTKPPETKETKPEDKQLSSLEQALVDAVEEKTRHSGYEVLIRVLASSNTAQKSQTILSNLVATFSLFDAPGKNGFKFTPAKDIEEFTTAYILRFFPPETNQNILNSVELATIFHFPDQHSTPTAQLERQSSKQVDGPSNVPDAGLLLGYNIFRGVKKEVRLSDKDRQRHMYVVGQTGTGKSVYLKNLALQDMLDGKGFAFIDPHGDAVEDLLQLVPRERTEDVIYFSPADMDYPMGLNMFEYHNDDQKDFLIQEGINMLYKLYDPQHQGIIGPRYEHLFRNAALTVMADPEGGTFIDIPKLFSDRNYVDQKLKHVTDQMVIDFWTKEMPGSERSNEFGEVKSWFVSKFGAFLSNTMMRNIIGQPKSSFNLREIMDKKKILLVNLSKGRTGELNSKLLGMIFVMKFQAAAMSRADIPEDQRNDFCLYVDEFQNFSTESFATILAEARKYHLNLIVANQYIGQLTDEIRDAVFGNVGSVINLRASATDADFLVKYFSPTFDVDDIVKLPNYNAIVRIIIGGVPTNPFSMATLPQLGHPNPHLADALKQLSAAKYGKPRAVVESDIFKRLETKTPPKPAFGNQFGAPAGSTKPYTPQTGGFGSPSSPIPGGAAPNTSTSSFLDEWLAKRKMTVPPVAPVGPGAGPSGVLPNLPDQKQSGQMPDIPEMQHREKVIPPPPPKPPLDVNQALQDEHITPLDQVDGLFREDTEKPKDEEKSKILKKSKVKNKLEPEVILPEKKEETGEDTTQLDDINAALNIQPGSSDSEMSMSAEHDPKLQVYIDKDGNLHYGEQDTTVATSESEASAEPNDTQTPQ